MDNSILATLKFSIDVDTDIRRDAASSTANAAVAPADGRQREYCQWETFEARCAADDQLVVISDAVYGRMSYGRCVRPGYGHVGCEANVRRLAAAQCSGRHRCQISVPDQLLDRTRPCREDLKLHLLIGYTCVTGERERAL